MSTGRGKSRAWYDFCREEGRVGSIIPTYIRYIEDTDVLVNCPELHNFNGYARTFLKVDMISTVFMI